MLDGSFRPPELNTPPLVSFFGLNAIRVIGVISLILVLASSVLVMVTDVTAVNTFLQDAKDSGTPVDQLLEGCDYIECVSFRLFDFHSSPSRNIGTARFRTKLEESFGLLSIGY